MTGGLRKIGKLHLPGRIPGMADPSKAAEAAEVERPNLGWGSGSAGSGAMAGVLGERPGGDRHRQGKKCPNMRGPCLHAGYLATTGQMAT